MLPLGLCAQLACIWEATARKPGNVHPGRDFADVSYADFLQSAAAIGPVLEAAPTHRVGDTVLNAVRATRRVVASNTNLGILLLLGPLATVPTETPLRAGLPAVLDGLDVADAVAVFEAIRLAQPGGLGEVRDQDVQQAPTLPLREIMQLAADRDFIARQYATGFQAIFDEGVPALLRGLERTGSLEGAIIHCQLHWLAGHPDSLIARKRGLAEAEEAGRRAQAVLAANWPHGATGREVLAEFDGWLRAEGHGRNPGTSADLVTACLFVAVREGTIRLPLALPFSQQ